MLKDLVVTEKTSLAIPISSMPSLPPQVKFGINSSGSPDRKPFHFSPGFPLEFIPAKAGAGMTPKKPSPCKGLLELVASLWETLAPYPLQ
jgi:hypothetical protein